jgi:two-component system sensor histidine kinase FlrB
MYVKRSYLQKEMFELDKPLLVEGVFATLVMFTLLVVFLEQRRQVQLKHQSEKAALNRELEEQHALALLGRMTATLAHELKTPVATLSNLVYALPSRAADPNFANRFVVLAKEELGRTQQLIDNLLFYGRDIRLTNAEWIPLVDFVGGLAQKAGVHLDCTSGEIYGDRFYLGLLFENLIRNSIQAQAKKIEIKANAIKEVAEIHFEDDGVGFPEDIKLDELIKPFVTLRSTGAGLGLYLVRKILIAHNGELSLYRKECGARIKLCMPSTRFKNHDSKP